MSEDSCKWEFVYELQQIRIMGHRYPRRKIRINKIGIYDTRKHAEQALQDYVQQEKRKYSCWDKEQIPVNKIGIFDSRKQAERALQAYVQQEKRDYSRWDKAQTYYADCLGYYIVEYRLCASLEQYSKDVPVWRSYTADGQLNDRSKTNHSGVFCGRRQEDIRFHVGDMVEIVSNDYVELAVVGALPPTKEWYQERVADCRETYTGRQFRLDFSDDCYLVYPFQAERGYHEHVVCYNVFRPTKPVPKHVLSELQLPEQ